MPQDTGIKILLELKKNYSTKDLSEQFLKYMIMKKSDESNNQTIK